MINILEIKPNVIRHDLKNSFCMFYGEPGTWKTTVASQFPRPLILALEIGYQFIDGAVAVPITSWSDVKDVFRQLKSKQVKDKFDTIVFDTITGIDALAQAWVLQKYGVEKMGDVPYGQAWSDLKAELKIVEQITKMGYGVVFLAHANEKETTKEVKGKIVTETVITNDLSNRTAATIEALCDFIFYIRKEKDEEGNTICMAYSDLPTTLTKSRLPNFPKRIKFTFEELEKHLSSTVLANGGVIEEENVKVVEEVDFEVLKNETINLAKALLETAVKPLVEKYLPENFDIPLKQVDELYRGRLIAARDYFLDLKATL